MRISLVTESQHESLADLLCELHGHYNEGASVSRSLVRRYLVEDLLSADSPLRLAVATEEQDVVVGLAAITLTYSLVEPSPERRRQCWLKELYVRASHRGGGIGRTLMSWVAFYAMEQGCSRIDWPVRADNERGIAFYEMLGASRVGDRLSYRLSGSALQALADRVDVTCGARPASGIEARSRTSRSFPRD